MYPCIEPYYSDWLEVSPRHRLYVERSGTAGGFPVFFIHGGPGSSSKPGHRRYFDPAFYDIVLFDQRGCGKSTPAGEVTDNDTWALVEDINRIRQALGITGRICLFGGSWGSTLALAYASRYPQTIAAMILRGIFLGTDAEVHWFTHGLARFAVSAWHTFAASGAEDLVGDYHQRLNSPDPETARQAARDWARYEMQTMRIGTAEQDNTPDLAQADDESLLARARVQLHYLINHCFLPDSLLLNAAPGIEVPVSIVQGGLDFICPPITASRLAQALPQASLRLVPDAGHDGTSGTLAGVLTEEADALRDRLRKKA